MGRQENTKKPPGRTARRASFKKLKESSCSMWVKTE